jgi:hypothetical protein
MDKVQSAIQEERRGLNQERTGLGELSGRFPEISNSLDEIVAMNTERCRRLADLQEFLTACGAKAHLTTKILVGV